MSNTKLYMATTVLLILNGLGVILVANNLLSLTAGFVMTIGGAVMLGYHIYEYAKARAHEKRSPE